ncbi:Osmotin, thaumatin-like protein [Fistulina hepatica ATCC 64428]|uniref:Osmotin, thaumatin-like protein n=1 Tax=Fistulina hepatica ATCC 64428 TaxID=1128425 RepID=A0A0D7AAR5_9AGAR|nr:Osmotin, thaumatin-like protein [Fistulina hepatica ATCC 64428]
MQVSVLLFSLTAAVVASAQRTFTVANNCDYTVWPAIYTGSGTGPDYATGWEADAGSSVSFSVPDDWTAGQIWGRTECDFSEVQGPTSCATGGCNGGLECDTSGGTGVPPATLAEFTLDADSVDYYDVSVADGFNVPLAITNNVGCSSASCPVDLNTDCPSVLQYLDSSGNIVGCESACEADLDDDPTNSANCCTGEYDTAATCPSSGVEYYSYFKGNCPDAYAYVYDEPTSPLICVASLDADFTITFCPS